MTEKYFLYKYKQFIGVFFSVNTHKSATTKHMIDNFKIMFMQTFFLIFLDSLLMITIITSTLIKKFVISESKNVFHMYYTKIKNFRNILDICYFVQRHLVL